MPFAFRFRALPFIAAVLVAVIAVLLGNWQQGRAAQKAELQARRAARGAEPPLLLGPAIQPAAPLEFRRVRLQGEFRADWPVFLSNRPMNGQSGFILAMPFKIAGGDSHVLVLRGWLPRQAEYGKLPPFSTPAGLVTLEGQVVSGSGRVMELGGEQALQPGALVQNLAPQDLARAAGLAMQPFLVQQLTPAAPGDELARDWPAPEAGIDKHRGYAFQWYALAAMAILFFVITGFRSGRKHIAGKSD
ncbi:cytochrome oxidase biosynthesis protein [Massilia sp. KIM]|uniref:SURF1 family protein n=1 Tax=Massilia sp. KIM TaxID=1955422 RepID=UPI0009901934|nr:SURF1 family protein [Massilia sp. KIM]OON64336.1 cytochrome oxidase biosynthesis protein [Massilia sp. KIM]